MNGVLLGGRGLRLLVPAALVWGIGCAETPQQEMPVAESEISAKDRLLLASAKVALPPPGVLAGDLPEPHGEGAQFVQRYCATCHALPTPVTHSATDWPGVVRRMWLRMDNLDSAYHVAMPTAAERMVMLDYLIANALKVSGSDLPAGPGREMFSLTCSRCHELPDPRQHSPDDWTAVVRRMSVHLEVMLGESLSHDDVGRIASYLRTISAATD